MTLDDVILIGVGLGILGFRRKERKVAESPKVTEPKEPLERKTLGNRFTRTPYTWKVPDGWKPPGNDPDPPTITTGPRPGSTAPPPPAPPGIMYETTIENGQICYWRVAADGSMQKVCYNFIGRTDP